MKEVLELIKEIYPLIAPYKRAETAPCPVKIIDGFAIGFPESYKDNSMANQTAFHVILAFLLSKNSNRTEGSYTLPLVNYHECSLGIFNANWGVVLEELKELKEQLTA